MAGLLARCILGLPWRHLDDVGVFSRPDQASARQPGRREIQLSYGALKHPKGGSQVTQNDGSLSIGIVVYDELDKQKIENN